jgi:hypothetical protein
MTRHHSPSTSHFRRGRLPLLLLLAGVAMAAKADLPMPDSDDPRRIYDQRTAPDWLRAVGKLQVPGIRFRDGRRSHNLEDCSATLIAAPAAPQADLILTAWHCLAYYTDLSKSITFTLLPDSSAGVTREAVRLADGGGMHADWAILRLRETVTADRARALVVSADRGDPSYQIAMAGFSRDPGTGGHGAHLSYDPGCNITSQLPRSTESDCAAHKGASGGAVVQTLPGRDPQLLGVISQGDGEGVSTYVPVSVFRAEVEARLR